MKSYKTYLNEAIRDLSNFQKPVAHRPVDQMTDSEHHGFIANSMAFRDKTKAEEQKQAAEKYAPDSLEQAGYHHHYMALFHEHMARAHASLEDHEGVLHHVKASADHRAEEARKQHIQNRLGAMGLKPQDFGMKE